MKAAEHRKVAYVAMCEYLQLQDNDIQQSMYILEHRSSCGTSWIRPSWPRSGCILSMALVPSCEHVSCCMPDLVMLFIAINDKGSSFTPTPSVFWVASRYCTSKHHNNNIWYIAYIYIHHTSTIIHVSFLRIFHSSRQAGCPLFP